VFALRWVLAHHPLFFSAMSKRFIDTELFDDEWFMELPKDCKIGFIYYITKCNHAGILDLNKKLFEFQTGVKWNAVHKGLGNRLITVREGLFFMPKYLDYQYPNFPNSNVKQQQSAIAILSDLGLMKDEKLMVEQGLSNSYDNDNDNDNEDVNGNGSENKNPKKNKPRPPKIPNKDEFMAEARSCAEKNNYVLDERKAAVKYEAWKSAGWEDGKGNKIKNWKTKILHNIPYWADESADRMSKSESSSNKPYVGKPTGAVDELEKLYGDK